ncbi:MAG: diguanylate cyclase [Opitutaceae bacterium]|nr:diguanylate cyclase [Opitutaceae bacterium]
MTAAQKILIIEDDRLQFRVSEKLLANARMARFEVDWAQTFEDGLRLLLTGHYAACLLDYQLGVRDGLELLREARARGCHTPVIFLTAESSEAVDQAAMEAGASDYLVKGEITPRLIERSIRYSLKLGAALRELRELATRDALTGLLNRRAFDALLAEEVDRARRLGHPLTLVILDLDHFKTINDTHGHAAGDTVLAAAARVFEAEVRSIDRVARIGGEEFAVLLMETGAEEGLAVAQRLVDAVRARTVSLAAGGSLAFTASAGVAALPAYGESAAALLAAADKALYAAKHAGRDRAVLAT